MLCIGVSNDGLQCEPGCWPGGRSKGSVVSSRLGFRAYKKPSEDARDSYRVGCYRQWRKTSKGDEHRHRQEIFLICLFIYFAVHPVEIKKEEKKKKKKCWKKRKDFGLRRSASRHAIRRPSWCSSGGELMPPLLWLLLLVQKLSGGRPMNPVVRLRLLMESFLSLSLHLPPFFSKKKNLKFGTNRRVNTYGCIRSTDSNHSSRLKQPI